VSIVLEILDGKDFDNVEVETPTNFEDQYCGIDLFVSLITYLYSSQKTS